MTIIYKEHPESKIIELTLDNKITEQDIQGTMPKVEAFINTHGKIKVLEKIKDSFTGFESGIMTKGIEFDKKHLRDFSCCAIVTDNGLMGPLARIAASFFHIDIRVFHSHADKEAMDWLQSQ